MARETDYEERERVSVSIEVYGEKVELSTGGEKDKRRGEGKLSTRNVVL
jgi:hypothetical protein